MIETEKVEKALMSLLGMPEGSTVLDVMKEPEKYKIYLYVMGMHHSYENYIEVIA